MKVEVPSTYPRPIPFEGKVRNGRTPDWSVGTGVALSHQFALRHQRKLVFSQYASSGGSSPVGTDIRWRWKCRTGENVESASSIRFRAMATAKASDAATSTDTPRWRINVGGTNSAWQEALLTESGIGARALQLMEATVDGLAADTEYDCYLETDDGIYVYYLMVFEEIGTLGGVDLDHTAVMDHRPYLTQGDITDTQHTQLYSVPYLLYRHNHAHGFNIVKEGASSYSRVPATYANMLDQTASTTVSANTPGVNLQLQHHAPAHKSTVTCVFAAWALFGGSIKLVDANGDVSGSTLSTFSAVGEWKQATVEIDASTDLTKLDLHIQGDGFLSIQVHAVSLYPYIT